MSKMRENANANTFTMRENADALVFIRDDTGEICHRLPPLGYEGTDHSSGLFWGPLRNCGHRLSTSDRDLCVCCELRRLSDPIAVLMEIAEGAMDSYVDEKLNEN